MNVGVKHMGDKAHNRGADGVLRPDLDANLKRPSLEGSLARATNHGPPHSYVVLLRPEVNVGVGRPFQGLQFLQSVGQWGMMRGLGPGGRGGNGGKGRGGWLGLCARRTDTHTLPCGVV